MRTKAEPPLRRRGMKSKGASKYSPSECADTPKEPSRLRGAIQRWIYPGYSVYAKANLHRTRRDALKQDGAFDVLPDMQEPVLAHLRYVDVGGGLFGYEVVA